MYWDNRQLESLLLSAVNTAAHPPPPDDSLFQPTSVMALAGNNPEPFLLLIQKADVKGYPWRNQMAFPGGHVDPRDPDRLSTALREMEEEMAVHRDHVRVVGSLGHFQTINSRDIEAFLGVWEKMGDIQHDPREISRVIRIPLAHFCKVHVSKGFSGRLPGIGELQYPYEDVVVWGVTAKIIHHLMEILLPLINDCVDGGPVAPIHG